MSLETVVLIVMVIYFALGYWATGLTTHRNVVLVLHQGNYFLSRTFCAIFFGWILIPVAILISVLSKKG